MIKFDFTIKEDEKKFILNKHINATKNNYLVEQQSSENNCLSKITVQGPIINVEKGKVSTIVNLKFSIEKLRNYTFNKNGFYSVWDPTNKEQKAVGDNGEMENKWFCKSFFNKDMLFIKQVKKYYFVKYENFDLLQLPSGITPEMIESNTQPVSGNNTQIPLFSDCFSEYTKKHRNDKMIVIELSSTTSYEKYSFYNDNNKSYNVFGKNDKLIYTGTWECEDGNLYITNNKKEKFLVDKSDFYKRTPVQQTPSPQTSPVSTSIFQQDNDGSFGYGSISRWVGKLQDVLNKLGKTDDQGNELKVDRKFGKKTISALKTLEDYEDFESGDEITVGEIRDIINNYKKSQGQTTQSTEPTHTRVGTQSDSTTDQSTSTPDTSTTGLEVTFDDL